jgi:hypothetical protein
MRVHTVVAGRNRITENAVCIAYESINDFGLCKAFVQYADSIERLFVLSPKARLPTRPGPTIVA